MVVLQCFLLSCSNYDNGLVRLSFPACLATLLSVTAHLINPPCMDDCLDIWLVNPKPKCIAGYNYLSICTFPLLLNAALNLGASYTGIIYIATQLGPYLFNVVNAAGLPLCCMALEYDCLQLSKCPRLQLQLRLCNLLAFYLITVLCTRLLVCYLALYHFTTIALILFLPPSLNCCNVCYCINSYAYVHPFMP